MNMKKELLKQMASRLGEVNDIIKKLDPTIREASFNLLAWYVTDGKTQPPPQKPEDNASDEISDSDFFIKFDHQKPSDNVLLIAAHFYSQFGAVAISADEIRSKADEVGVTAPARPDMTLNNARRDGKLLFTRMARGLFKPTVHGEKFFKETYSVRKGTKQKPATSEASAGQNS